MKSILYAGATLMIGVSIYGFADYKRTSHRKEIINMYKAKEVPGPAMTSTKTNEPAVKKEIIAAEIPETETTMMAIKRVSGTEKKYNPVKKMILNNKLFSRAPLKARHIGNELPEEPLMKKPEKIKTESVKTENKEP